MRVIAIEETALGLFSRYKRDRRDRVPAARSGGRSRRASTRSTAQEAQRLLRRARAGSPTQGGWRSPVPGRAGHVALQPEAHAPGPEEGRCRTTAPTTARRRATPIYSAYRGVVSSVGPARALRATCHDRSPERHPDGLLRTCRASRPRIKVGDRVGTHQLIGYVGLDGPVDRAAPPFQREEGRRVLRRRDARSSTPSAWCPRAIDRPAFLATQGRARRAARGDPAARSRRPSRPSRPPRPAARAAECARCAPGGHGPRRKGEGGDKRPRARDREPP